MKNKIKIILIIVGILFVLLVAGAIGYYFYSLESVSKNSEEVTFIIEPGKSKKSIIKDLKAADLIKDANTLLIYMFFNKDKNLQAGTYVLNKNMTAPSIIEKFHKGDVKLNTIDLTMTGGQNIKDLIKIISKNFLYSQNEVEKVLNDPEFIKKMIEKYDFLTNDILNDNIYYALEGYLFPDTYTYLEDASVEDIIIKMLDNTKNKLKTLETLTNNSKYTIHEIMTKASIIELEAKTLLDRQKVSQVIDYRLSNKWTGPLGMDVTTYYAVGKSMNESLSLKDLNTINLYNTRDQSGNMNNKLPVGPICNPSLTSIEAALTPTETEYAWFIANVCTGEVFFQTTSSEFLAKNNELRQICNLN